MKRTYSVIMDAAALCALTTEEERRVMLKLASDDALHSSRLVLSRTTNYKDFEYLSRYAVKQHMRVMHHLAVVELSLEEENERREEEEEEKMRYKDYSENADEDEEKVQRAVVDQHAVASA